MEIAITLINVVRLYGLIGLGVAAVFLLVGMDRIDKDSQGAYLFRPLLIPGIVVLWPIVLLRWITLERSKRREVA